MSMEELDFFDMFLQEPDPEIVKWIVGSASPPTPWSGEFIERLREHANSNPLSGKYVG
eukprot:CAMPEP_0177629016 /NCGR_PEP_ID=MMETSP0447-20121125/439_1 /TAXON_ID=0 /ORGANISM="Stygamoeba regulata, Strain BSH-02190019" /LENGTH=57 /DNA_ID=CAMNT_0019130301 /DNA_START=248 /DNA_END=421 /DNA_ORIENTATION=-